jgi:DNA-binding MurR/RpiR family transcriptional regulator
MTTSPDDGAGERISYRARDLFDRIDQKLDYMLEEIRKKADRTEVDAAVSRIEQAEKVLLLHEEARTNTAQEMARIRGDVSTHVGSPHAASAKLDERVAALERKVWIATGAALASGGVLGVVAKALIG